MEDVLLPSSNRRHEPLSPDELHKTAKTFLEVGMAERAVPYLIHLVSQRPWSADIHADLAQAYRETSQHIESLDALTRAATLDSTNGWRHIELGSAQLNLSHFHDAHDSFTTALRYWLDDPVAIAGLGVSLARLTRYAEAAEMLERAQRAKLDPLIDYVAANLAWVYCALGRFTDAANLLNDPALPQDRADLIQLRAFAETYLTPSLATIKTLKRAHVLEPANLFCHFSLAAHQVYLGWVFQARDTLVTALQSIPSISSQERGKLLQSIETLNEYCQHNSMSIAAGGSFTDHPALYPPPLDESETDSDRFACYIESITNMPGCIYRSLLEHGWDAIALYDQGIEALDATYLDIDIELLRDANTIPMIPTFRDAGHRDLALARFRTLFDKCQDDPIICKALITAFDMLRAPDDVEAAHVKREELQNHPRLRALTLYDEAVKALSTHNLRTVVDRLHDLESFDPAMARYIRHRLDSLNHPDYTYEPDYF